MTPLFPDHKVVQMYHADYARHFNLNSYIKLNRTVSSALWVGSSTDGYWDISTRTGYPTEIIPGNSSSPEQDVQEESTERFDHLVIATGHNHYPKFPRWAINNNWIHGREGRRIVHSIYYREPRDYQNKVVLVVGAGSSGIDIASQIREYAEKVRLEKILFAGIHASFYRHITLIKVDE
jgi:cation diffusion facilitator CzcD-associated flavoprotein CzcO